VRTSQPAIALRGKVVSAQTLRFDEDDNFRLCSAIKVAMNMRIWDSQRFFEAYIDEHPYDAGMLLSSVGYAHQLKRGLRLDTNHPTNQCGYVDLDSLHLSSCIEQALKCENVSRLA